jgi:hypothetical protein
MVAEPTIIHVTPGSELDRLVETAKETQVILEKEGVRYRLTREGVEPWIHYDPEAVRAAVRAAAGTISAEEGNALKEYIYRAREDGSRPADRP